MKQIKSFLDKLFNSSLDKGEFKQLMKHVGGLRNQKQKDKWLDEMESIDEEQNSKGIPSYSNDYKADFVNRLKAKANREKTLPMTSKVYHKKKGYPWLKVAAVFLLSAVTSLTIYFSNYHGVETPLRVLEAAGGQKLSLVLSDGTKVKLNSESKLTYAREFEGDTREVILEGEAFFEVFRDESQPFIVKTNDITTTVLGTSFNVKAYPDDDAVEVAVLTGKVEVEESRPLAGGQVQKAMLSPNELVSYSFSDRKMTKQSGDISDRIAWKDGRLILEMVTLGEALQDLEKWYGVEIVLENDKMGQCLLKLEIKGESLGTVLSWLQFTLDDFEYEIRDKIFYLKGKGCSAQEN